MTTQLRTSAILATLLAACTLGAATARAATPPPPTFYGVVPQGSLTDQDFARMGQAKVGTLRFEIFWAGVNPSPGVYDWSAPDYYIRRAAQNGVQALPFIFSTPTWVAHLDGQSCSDALCPPYAPRGPEALAAWATFLQQAVSRYGPGGTFWAENPGVPQLPIHAWQLWNEQNSSNFYKPKPSPKAFGKLIAAGHAAILGTDPTAEVILGGMFGTPFGGRKPSLSAWDFLGKLYDQKGAKKNFEGVAPHPYAAKLSKVQAQIDLIRDEIKSAHDRSVELWITELGWASGGVPNPLNRGPVGQAQRLRSTFNYFLKKRNKFNVANVEWYSWRDNSAGDAVGLCLWCPMSGLLAENFSAKPSLGAFTAFTGGS